ncbi:MAG: peptide deformylase [Verrucomicrobiota bacterium]
MILPITYYGNPVLRKQGSDITEITEDLRQLADDMIETMHDASGIGLAAQQIGKAIQLAVIDIPGEVESPSRMWINGQPVNYADYMPLVLINPKLEIVKKKESATEGCLSFPGITAEITRPTRVACTCLRLDGEPFSFESDGLLGRAVQHETDHLNGILFTDHMQPDEKRSLRDAIEDIRQSGLKQVDSS